MKSDWLLLMATIRRRRHSKYIYLCSAFVCCVLVVVAMHLVTTVETCAWMGLHITLGKVLPFFLSLLSNLVNLRKIVFAITSD